MTGYSKVRIGYVSGIGRSGSTILELILATLPGAFGAGELTRLFEAAAASQNCSCGAAILDCSVWSSVLAVTDKFGSLRDRALLTRCAEQDGRSREQWSALWGKTISALVSVTGSELLIDSSKTTRLTRHRMKLLAAEGYDLVSLQPVRRPEFVAASAKFGSNQALEEKQVDRRSVPPLRTLASWIRWNHFASRTCRQLAIPSRVVMSDEIRRRPYEVRDDLAVLLAAHAVPEGPMSLVPGHGIGGNRLRRSGQLEELLSRSEEAGHETLTWFERVSVRFIGEPYYRWLARPYNRLPL